MSEQANPNAAPADDQPKDVPYELLPTLASNERFVQVCEELRRLKQIKDELFEDRIGDDGKKRPSYWDELKLEAGALASVSGAKSVAFIDLRIAQTEPGVGASKITGASVMNTIMNTGASEIDEHTLRAIAVASKDCDADTLVQYGVPPHVVAASRVYGKPRSGSTRIEWIGKRGPAAGKRGAGGGGSVQ